MPHTDLPVLVRDTQLRAEIKGDYTVHSQIKQRWKRVRKIGEGGFGSVYVEKRVVKGASSQPLRAVKRIRNATHEKYIHELEAIAKFSHHRYEHRFVKSYGWYEDGDSLYIAMEYMKLGDLYQSIAHMPPLSEPESALISSQILEGLEFMHENKFAHRDMKPQNVLVVSAPPETWWIKIADFGISKHLEMGNHTTTGIKGSLDFMAPELLLGKRDKASIAARDHFKTDMWAVGCITYYLLTKRSPFLDFDTLVEYRQGESQCPAAELGDDVLGNVGREFLTSLLSIKPSNRPTAQEAQKHSWFATLHQLYAEADDETHRSSETEATSSARSSLEAGDAAAPTFVDTGLQHSVQASARWTTLVKTQLAALPPVDSYVSTVQEASTEEAEREDDAAGRDSQLIQTSRDFGLAVKSFAAWDHVGSSHLYSEPLNTAMERIERAKELAQMSSAKEDGESADVDTVAGSSNGQFNSLNESTGGHHYGFEPALAEAQSDASVVTHSFNQSVPEDTELCYEAIPHVDTREYANIGNTAGVNILEHLVRQHGYEEPISSTLKKGIDQTAPLGLTGNGTILALSKTSSGSVASVDRGIESSIEQESEMIRSLNGSPIAAPDEPPQHQAMPKSSLVPRLKSSSAQQETRMIPSRGQVQIANMNSNQYQELSTDVHDELMRREDAEVNPSAPTHLQPARDFNEKRNRAREKFSTLSSARFKQLAMDVVDATRTDSNNTGLSLIENLHARLDKLSSRPDTRVPAARIANEGLESRSHLTITNGNKEQSRSPPQSRTRSRTEEMDTLATQDLAFIKDDNNEAHSSFYDPIRQGLIQRVKSKGFSHMQAMQALQDTGWQLDLAITKLNGSLSTKGDLALVGGHAMSPGYDQARNDIRKSRPFLGRSFKVEVPPQGTPLRLRTEPERSRTPIADMFTLDVSPEGYEIPSTHNVRSSKAFETPRAAPTRPVVSRPQTTPPSSNVDERQHKREKSSSLFSKLFNRNKKDVAKEAEPEYEPNVDNIRGAAAIIRKLDEARRQKYERIKADEEAAKQVSPLNMDMIIGDEWVEWDGLRRRKSVTEEPFSTTSGSPPRHSRNSESEGSTSKRFSTYPSVSNSQINTATPPDTTKSENGRFRPTVHEAPSFAPNITDPMPRNLLTAKKVAHSGDDWGDYDEDDECGVPSGYDEQPRAFAKQPSNIMFGRPNVPAEPNEIQWRKGPPAWAQTHAPIAERAQQKVQQQNARSAAGAAHDSKTGDENDSSEEETIEQRVEKIKARVIELIGNMDPEPQKQQIVDHRSTASDG